MSIKVETMYSSYTNGLCIVDMNILCVCSGLCKLQYKSNEKF